jgi:hypothetical protein
MTNQSLITCPRCGTSKLETMPTDACWFFYECSGCGTLLRPKPGDCCVFCSYGTVPCPPIQQAGQVMVRRYVRHIAERITNTRGATGNARRIEAEPHRVQLTQSRLIRLRPREMPSTNSVAAPNDRSIGGSGIAANSKFGPKSAKPRKGTLLVGCDSPALSNTNSSCPNATPGA